MSGCTVGFQTGGDVDVCAMFPLASSQARVPPPMASMLVRWTFDQTGAWGLRADADSLNQQTAQLVHHE